MVVYLCVPVMVRNQWMMNQQVVTVSFYVTSCFYMFLAHIACIPYMWVIAADGIA